MSARWPCAGRDARGVTSIEFLIAFGPVFLLFLGMVQLALMGTARLVVGHAARRAVRAAVVVLEDDPARYGGAPRGQLVTSGSHTGGTGTDLLDYLGADETSHIAVAFGRPRPDGARMAAIRQAAHLPLAALVPDPRTFQRHLAPRQQNVVDAVSGTPALKLAYGLAVHLPLTTAVTFPEAPGSAELHTRSVPPKDSITVRVTHLFHCAVPVVAALLCDKVPSPNLPDSDDWQGWGDSKQAILRELQLAPLAEGHAVLALSSARFAMLQAEATLPAQKADYRYASEQAANR